MDSGRGITVFVTGTRGIPYIPGGVERHCQELYPRLAARGCRVTVCVRSPYADTRRDQWHGVQLLPCLAPRQVYLEAITHTCLSLAKALRRCPDIVHIHGIGPCIAAPLPRLAGFKVVMTHHGPEYERKKWGPFARAFLRLGERLGLMSAHRVIAVSSTIAGRIERRAHHQVHLIHNGVERKAKVSDRGFLDGMNIRPGRYILAVGRFVPEKGFHDLIRAFMRLKGDWRLVLAGDADHPSDYSRKLKAEAARDGRIRLTGYITKGPLEQLYSHARLFVLPSYHEGLPLVLLEAMSFGLPVLASDIPAHREMGLAPYRYFSAGDSVNLGVKMEELLNRDPTEAEMRLCDMRLKERYDWDRIADETMQVYQSVLG